MCDVRCRYISLPGIVTIVLFSWTREISLQKMVKSVTEQAIRLPETMLTLFTDACCMYFHKDEEDRNLITRALDMFDEVLAPNLSHLERGIFEVDMNKLWQ